MFADAANERVDINAAIYGRDVVGLDPAIRVQSCDAAGDAGIDAEDRGAVHDAPPSSFTPAAPKSISVKSPSKALATVGVAFIASAEASGSAGAIALCKDWHIVISLPIAVLTSFF